jgi:hypothetical protein
LLSTAPLSLLPTPLSTATLLRRSEELSTALSSALATVIALRSELASVGHPPTDSLSTTLRSFHPSLPDDAAALLSGASSVLEIMHFLSLQYAEIDLENYASHSASFIIDTFCMRFSDDSPDSALFRSQFIETFISKFYFRLLVTDESWADLLSDPPDPLPVPASLVPHTSAFHSLVTPPSFISIDSGFLFLNNPNLPPKRLLSYTGTDPIILARDDGVDIVIYPGFRVSRVFSAFFSSFSH